MQASINGLPAALLPLSDNAYGEAEPVWMTRMRAQAKRNPTELPNARLEFLGAMLELFGADYTFLNERLARHYGIDGVYGEEFRQVQYPNSQRKGILSHGSVLKLTSMADRTSPVLRGKWVLDNILGVDNLASAPIRLNEIRKAK